MENRQAESYSQPDQASAVSYPSGGSNYKSASTNNNNNNNNHHHHYHHHNNNSSSGANFSSSATPISEHDLPHSTRSGSFPDYAHPRSTYTSNDIVSQQHHAQSQSRYASNGQNHVATMAQSSNPSIAQSSPSYPPPPHNYSPYPQQQQHDMQQYPPQAMSYGRPEWAGHYQQPMAYGHAPASAPGSAPNMNAHVQRPPGGGHPLSTVYSFVPIPGAQQHKRPRRRYEEIERMYKCGWNGCEKAYGTLNHLNAHVTMQSHGQKRTPEEFKEIRKEWKAKKKEEENQRKQDEERARQEAQRSGQDTSQAPGQPGQYGQHSMMPPQMGGPQLPPIGYQPAGAQAPGQYGQPQQGDGVPQYSNGGQMYGGQPYPQSPYNQGGLPYQQQRGQ